MKLAQAKIRNFRAIKELDFDLDPRLTVFVGDNAVGKTCILDALAFGLAPIARRALGRVSRGDSRDIRRVDGIPAAFMAVQLVGGAEAIVWDSRALRDHSELTAREVNAVFPPVGRADLHRMVDPAVAARAIGQVDPPLPVLAYYGTDRSVAPRTLWFGRADRSGTNPALSALEGALNPMVSFRAAFRWFMDAEAEELRQRRDAAADFVHPGLRAVREAISEVIPGASNPRVTGGIPKLVVTLKEADGHHEDLDLEELSGGYRSMLALVIDLARRMALANPREGVRSEAVVLIDEVDLHLHPRWQQTVVPDLLRAFPNAQFIVTTHSDQVIGSVQPQHVLSVQRTTDNVELQRPDSTYGATPDRIYGQVMGLDHLRPKEVETALARYFDLIRAELGEESEAVALRAKLEHWFRGLEPEMIRADAEIARRKVMSHLRGGA